jgi:hypothetical protein
MAKDFAKKLIDLGDRRLRAKPRPELGLNRDAPGMAICQLFLHRVEVTGTTMADNSVLGASRRPRFRPIPYDDVAKRLSAPSI